jgi:hypothetical protein
MNAAVAASGYQCEIAWIAPALDSDGAYRPRHGGIRHLADAARSFVQRQAEGLRDLPDTIMTRAVVLRMRRRAC